MGKLRLPPRGRRDLLSVGPRIQIGIARPALLPNGNFAVPKDGFLSVEAIIDTGAGKTVINPEIANRIDLKLVDPAAGFAHVGGVDHCPVYVAAIRFPKELATVRLMRVFAIHLPEQPVRCLIGRDVLQLWRMIYDGRTGEVTIEEDEEGPPMIELD